MTRRLVLASASPARFRLLRDAGLDPDVVVSGVDETVADASDPWSLVEKLAVAKAAAVAARPDVAGGDAIVVGADSLLHLGGQVLGKPGSAAVAMGRWHDMRGSSGSLLTGHCVIDTVTGRTVSAVADTVVHFGTPTDDEITAYVATGEPLQVAGAFTLDGRSAAFIDGIDGDPGTVIGLSMPTLRELLGRLGVPIVSLWC